MSPHDIATAVAGQLDRLEPGDSRDRPRSRRPRHLGRPAPPRCARRAVGGRRRARRRAADGCGSARGQRVALHLRQRPGARRRSRHPGPARGRGLPPPGGRPGRRPSGGDGRARPRGRRPGPGPRRATSRRAVSAPAGGGPARRTGAAHRRAPGRSGCRRPPARGHRAARTGAGAARRVPPTRRPRTTRSWRRPSCPQRRTPRLELRSLRLLAGDLAIARRTAARRGDRASTGPALATRRPARATRSPLPTSARAIVVARVHPAATRRGLRAAPSRRSPQARATGDEEAIARSLDGLKTVHHYVGDALGLRPRARRSPARFSTGSTPPGSDSGRVLECRPRSRGLRATGTPALAAGRPRAAAQPRDRLRRVRRRTSARSGPGWPASPAISTRRSTTAASRSPRPHRPRTRGGTPPLSGVQATTLLELGRPDEAATLCTRRARALWRRRPARRTGCAASHRSSQRPESGSRRPTGCTPRSRRRPAERGSAGADVYDALTTAWLEVGEPERAAPRSRPLLDATRGCTGSGARPAPQRTSASQRRRLAAPSEGTRRSRARGASSSTRASAMTSGPAVP